MKIPYHNAHVCKGIIFAARSGQLHSFNSQDGRYISTWKHPDAEKVSNACKAIAEAEKAEAETAEAAKEVPSAPQEDGDEPPAKRQKTVEAEDTSSIPAESTPSDKGKGKDQAEKKKSQRGARFSSVSKVPDRPLIAHITSSADGKHVVVITAHDKAIWVFEHDLAGNLKELSKRVMPKRPSSVFLGPDSQIICADKFGDVYAVPLIQSTTWVPAPSKKQVASKPEANPLTVHSKRNLESLKSQLKQIELNKKDSPNSDVPAFEQTLLLGHVSMLTSVILGEQEGRRYVLTADRDEHIRVSRYIPQTHVIQSFCLGHKEFVNALAIPQARNDTLVSGGGDPNLFLWNWESGKLVSKTDLLALAQTVFPETSELAVSQLESFSYPSDSRKIPYILAICEDIKAIFAWQLTSENALSHPSIIQLPGNPLHLALNLEDESSPKIVVALDPGSEGAAQSLNVYSFKLSEGTLAIDTTNAISESATAESEDLVASETEVRSLLYTVEHLRKKTAEIEEDGEKAVEANAEGQA